jgi:hypothetical protein
LGYAPHLEPLLTDAGALEEPVLRSLDTIHVMASADLSGLDAFVSYDERQSAATRLVGLRTVGPEAKPSPLSSLEPTEQCHVSNVSGVWSTHTPLNYPIRTLLRHNFRQF